MKLKYLAATAVIAAMPAIAQAQLHPNTPKGEVKVLLENTADSGKVYNVFIENAPKVFHSARAPQFAIVGKNDKFYLGIGGTVKGTVSYDFGNPIDNPNCFTTSDIPMSLAKGNGGLVQFSGQQSNLFVNFVGMPGTENSIGAYFSANFMGEGYGMQLSFAYLTFRGFTMGYNYSLFSDMAAVPPTIDYEGPCGLTAIPNGVLDYEHAFNKHWKAGVGIEAPIASFTTGAAVATVNQRVPDVPAYIQYSWGNGANWLRFSGIMRNFAYRDLVADKNDYTTGWGVKLSGSAAIAPQLRSYYQVAYGKGVSSYFQDIYGGGLDMTPDAHKAGKLDLVESWGGYVGLQYNFTPKLMSTVTYSMVRDYADKYAGGATPWTDQYKYAQYCVANVFYNITSNLQAGVEYIYGRRVDMDGTSRHDNRIQTALTLSF